MKGERNMSCQDVLAPLLGSSHVGHLYSTAVGVFEAAVKRDLCPLPRMHCFSFVILIKVETVLNLAFIQRHRWRWVCELRMASVCWCSTEILSVSGNLNRPPLKKEPQERETLYASPAAASLTASPVLTCVWSRLMAASHRHLLSRRHRRMAVGFARKLDAS